MRNLRNTSPLRRFLIWYQVLALLLCAGCSPYTTCRSWVANGFKVGPEFCPPSAPLEAEWIDMQTDPRLVAETADLSQWWTVLGDPTLNGLMESAYDENLTLRQAGTRIQQAAAIRAIAVGNLFPQLQQAVGDYQRVQTSENIAVPSPVRRFSQFDLGLQASWELDFWGRFRRSVAVADANLDASIAAYDEVAVLLLGNVALTYVEIRTAQERLEIARSIVELQQGSLDIAAARYQAGQTNKLDVIQAQNNIDITEAAIPLLQEQLRVANNRLCVLLGIPPQDLVSQFPPAPIPTVSRSVQVGIPADLLRRRPDIRRTQRLMMARSERIGIAEAELYPHISLIGSFQWQAEDIDDLFDASSAFALISPGFNWNILNYGRLISGVELERERFRESVYDYQQTVLTAQQEVEDAMIGFLKSQDRADKLADAVAQVNEAESIALTLYDTGGTDFNRVFVIQAFQFTQQDDWVVSRASVVLNLIRIYRALGGGWQFRCPGGGSGVPLTAFGDQADGGMIGAIPSWDERQLETEIREPARMENQQSPDAPTQIRPAAEAEPAVDQSRARLKELLENPAAEANDPPAQSSPSADQTDRRLRELLDNAERNGNGLPPQPNNDSRRLDELLEGDAAESNQQESLEQLSQPTEPN